MENEIRLLRQEIDTLRQELGRLRAQGAKHILHLLPVAELGAEA